MLRAPLIVLKFGGSVLVDVDCLRTVVHEIYRWRRDGWQVLAVVSALAGRTRSLIDMSRRVCGRSTPESQATLLGVGETEAAALLGLQLDRAGIPTRVLSPATLRFRAVGPELDADPSDIDVTLIHRALDDDNVVVVPGFVATDDCGRTVTLGRGGSDLSALFIAHAVNADRCLLIKDVDGLYESDPQRQGPQPRRFETATYEDALSTDGSIVQHKAIRFAREVGRAFELGRFNGTRPTIIGVSETVHGPPEGGFPPLRVALLGLGTVGGGVLDLLRRLPDVFEVVGAVVRGPERYRSGVPTDLRLSDDPLEVFGLGVDVVVEALGGIATPRAAVALALEKGANVVTANKALLAEAGEELQEVARVCGSRLLGSASVGGAVPVLEELTRHRVRRVRGVLNGTTNFVLDEMARGVSVAESIIRAQELGLAEQDPTRDLDGRDSHDKLAVLAQCQKWSAAADQVGLDFDPSRVPVEGERLRQIASVDRVTAKVRIDSVPPHDGLYDVPSEWNAVELEYTSGRCRVLRGKGAGRWPTAESVLGDLLSLARSRTESRASPEKTCCGASERAT